jgi:hypothetical protein
MRGVSLKVVAGLLGHSTTAITERYAHLSPEVERGAVDVLVDGGTDHWRTTAEVSEKTFGVSLV